MICCYLKLCPSIKRWKTSNCKLEQAEYSLSTLYLTNCKIHFAIRLSFKTLQHFVRYKMLFLWIPLPEFIFASEGCRVVENKKFRGVISYPAALESEIFFSAHAQSSYSRRVSRLYWAVRAWKKSYAGEQTGENDGPWLKQNKPGICQAQVFQVWLLASNCSKYSWKNEYLIAFKLSP